MAERIKFRLPSAVKYAYVDVEGTAEELAQVNFEMLASLYANGLHAFQAAEVRAAKVIVQGANLQHPEPTLKDVRDAGLLKVGDTVTVAGMEFTKHSESPFEGEDQVADQIKQELGATELDSVNAPWERPAKTAKAQPWETEKPKTKPVVDVEGW